MDAIPAIASRVSPGETATLMPDTIIHGILAPSWRRGEQPGEPGRKGNERKGGFELIGSTAEGFHAGPPSHLALSRIDASKDGADDWMAAWTVEIVLAYLASNAINADELPGLIARLKQVLREISEKDLSLNTGIRPAVPIGQSVTPDYIVCLEDGRRFKSMKRYIRSVYNLTPSEYRRKWGLPNSYPMVAPNYTALCADRARRVGLGKRGRRAGAVAQLSPA